MRRLSLLRDPGAHRARRHGVTGSLVTYPPDPIEGQPGYRPGYSDVPEDMLTDADLDRIARRHRLNVAWRQEQQTTGADRAEPPTQD